MSQEFVRTLLFARDLKINIRKRAVASFFEWDRLDSAMGGKSHPLGSEWLTYRISMIFHGIFRHIDSSASMKGHH